MRNSKLTFRTRWPVALAALVILSGFLSQRVTAQTPDIDKMTGRDIRYVTQDAMYLANEQWLLFACDLPAGQTDIGSNFNKDSYWYSRYNLGNLLMRSGMGIHMVYNPLFKQHSANDKKPDGTKMFPTPKDFMHFKIRQFCARTGLPCRLDPENMDNPKAFPPKGVFPIFLEFASGSPRFQQPPVPMDFTTLRWNPKSIDKTIITGALGQTLMKQVLWSEDFFANHRKGPNGEVWLGNKKEYGNGFRGAVLTAESITKMFALKSTLAYDPVSGKLGDVGDPATYDPMKGLRYYPHALRPKLVSMKPGMPPAPVAWEVVNTSSHLADQASLLWGTSEFYFYSDPTVKDSFDLVFGDQGDHKTKGALFPAKPHMLSKGLSVVAFKNMMAMHFDMKNGTFRSVAEPGTKRVVVVTAPEAQIKAGRETVGVVRKGQELPVHWTMEGWLGVKYTPRGAKTGNGATVKGWIKSNQVADITTADAGMALIALSNLHSRLHDAPAPLLSKVKMAINAQASFLREELMASDGGFYNGYTLESGAEEGARELLSQGRGIRGLLAAYSVTGDSSFKNAAEKAYAYMNQKLWSDSAQTYRSAEGAMESTYTPKNVGATLGALRELALAANGDARQQVVANIDKFFAATQTGHRQQLAEIDPTGEPIPPMDQMKKMKAQLMALMKKDPKRGKAMMMKMADVDGDGVPKPGMAGGEFGFAPVPAFAVKVATR